MWFNLCIDLKHYFCSNSLFSLYSNLYLRRFYDGNNITQVTLFSVRPLDIEHALTMLHFLFCGSFQRDTYFAACGLT